MSLTIKAIANLALPKINRSLILARCMSSSDIVKPATGMGGGAGSSSSPPVSPEALYDKIRDANTVRRVLDLVSRNISVMGNKHLMQALRTVFALQKHGCEDLTPQQVMKRPEFEHLCRRLKTQAGSIDINDTIEALKIVTYMGAPGNSTIVQTLLQLVRHNINHLTLFNIIFLDFLLDQHKQTTPLIDALRMALPLVFQVQCRYQMDRENVAHLAEYLFYVSRKQVSVECLQDIAQAALECPQEMDAKTAKSLVWSITDLPPHEFLAPLLKKALRMLTVHVDELSFVDMETTITKLLQAYTRRTPFYYDEVFFDTCADYLVGRDESFQNTLYILRKFSRVSHNNRYLIDHAVQKVIEQPDLLRKGNTVDLYSLVCSVATSDYRPPQWDAVLQLLEDATIADSSRKEIIWIKFISCLAMLRVFKEDLMKKYINEEAIAQVLRKGYQVDLTFYLAICHAVKLYRPDLRRLLPKRFAPDIVVRGVNPAEDYPMRGALALTLGGENFVKTNLLSKVGARIDHAVIFREGGNPVAWNADVEYIEDVLLAADYQMVLIMGLTEMDYTINDKQLRGAASLKIRALEAEKYSVVTVDLHRWQQLLDFEKQPYLMQAIKEKLNSDISVCANVGL